MATKRVCDCCGKPLWFFRYKEIGHFVMGVNVHTTDVCIDCWDKMQEVCKQIKEESQSELERVQEDDEEAEDIGLSVRIDLSRNVSD